MSLEPLSIREIENQSKDIYESVVVMSKRAKQVLGEDGILGDLPGFEVILAVPALAFVARRFRN